jgi:subtilisin family serine protease
MRYGRALVLVLLAAGVTATRGSEPLPPAGPVLDRPAHLALLGVDRWHAAGIKGKGVRVAVLDSGFRGYREHLGQALPDRITSCSFRRDGDLEAKDSRHGILCGEVIHAIAPEAELLFANWEPDEPEAFLNAVRWARQQRAQIITCSVIMPGWSDGQGGGAVHANLSRILGDGTRAGDPLGFAAAGNVAERHWAGAFQDDGRHFHQWETGRADNALAPWGSSPISIELTHPPAAAYRVHVLDAADHTGVGQVCRLPAGGIGGCAVRFQPTVGHRYMIRVEHVAGSAGELRLVVLGGTLELHNAKGSMVFPADGSSMLAVGAVDRAGAHQSYSCCGGGNCSTLKPDFVAPVPVATAIRPVPFSGTSAAAPQAAGLAALLWSKHANCTAAQVRERLRKFCLDVGEPGPDFETGCGLIHLDEK